MDSKKKARCPPSRYCTLCLDVTTSKSIPASSIKRSSRSASNGIDGATCLTTSSMSKAPSGSTSCWIDFLCPDRAWRPWPLRIIYQDRAIGPCLRFTAGAPCARSNGGTWVANRPPGSVPIARIEAVEHTKVSRPISGAAAAVVLFVLHHGLLADLRRDFYQLAAGCFHAQLDFGRLQQVFHEDESLARSPTYREHTMVVHDHRAIVAEVSDESIAFVKVFGNSLVRMVAERAEETHRLLRDHP